MPHPNHAHLIELIHLADGQRAPEGATWVCLSIVGSGACRLQGNIAIPGGVMFDWGTHENGGKALEAATVQAIEQRVAVLYVETHAR